MIKRTWAPRGKTPIVTHSYRWSKLSAISGVTSTGKLYFQLTLDAIRGLHVAGFLVHLLRHIKEKIVILWDNTNPHKSNAVKKVIQENKDRLAVFFTPPYSPDFNPDEGVWDQIKYHYLANFCPRNDNELRRGIRLGVVRLRRHPDKILGFFAHSALGL